MKVPFLKVKSLVSDQSQFHDCHFVQVADAAAALSTEAPAALPGIKDLDRRMETTGRPGAIWGFPKWGYPKWLVYKGKSSKN